MRQNAPSFRWAAHLQSDRHPDLNFKDMKRAKEFKEFVKQKDAWYKSVCEMADEIFPPGLGCRNYLDHDGQVVTVTNSGWAHYLRQEVGCFIAPAKPIWNE